MRQLDIQSPMDRIPEGSIAVPVTESQLGAVLKLCVLVNSQSDPVSGHFVLLRETLDIRVLLGCITDAGGHLRQWVELWIQNPAGLSSPLLAAPGVLGNALSDSRWERTMAGGSCLDPGSLICTGFENTPALPTYISKSKSQPVHPTDPKSGERWILCTDEAVLSTRGLPGYAASLHRYLFLKSRGIESRLIPATPDAPTNEFTLPLNEVLGDSSDFFPFNPAAGMMTARKLAPLALEAFFDALTAGSPESISPPEKSGNGQPESTGALTWDGWMFLGAQGTSGRLLESFHLKLRALSDAIRSVECTTRLTQRPLLNLSAESFRVTPGVKGRGLPSMWTAKTDLVNPGDALQLPVKNVDLQYFVPAQPSAISIYQPLGRQAVKGRASVRIRQLLQEGNGTILEGTFATQERLELAGNDLVWFRLSLGSDAIDLYSRLQSETALAKGEWRFRTLPHRLEPQLLERLNAAAGVPIGNVSFAHLPQLTTPCDLYSLGVLSVRALLVNRQTTLPRALDEILSLARQIALEYDAAIALSLRVRGVCEREARLIEALGPHRLAQEEMQPARAMDLIPPALWWEALAMIVRMMPGVGPDSICRDYGAAPAGGLHRIFAPTVADLDMLLLRTRSLIMIDWRSNCEIQGIIKSRLDKLVAESASGG